jgi:hypothetical protein
MSNRTWVCISCRKSFRRVQTVPALNCPQCHGACEYVDWKIHIPSSRQKNAWELFWKKYRAEKELMEAWHRGELRKTVTLEILNRVLLVE